MGDSNPAHAATWQRLLEGHSRSGEQDLVAGAHEPVAAILACSDARVPPSVIFDQPAGSLFVVRVAGNTAGAAALASLDYAVDSLGVDVVIVLGHTGCGAVQAAVDGACGGHLEPIVEPICRLARIDPQAGVDEIVRANVANTVTELGEHDGPTGRAGRTGRVQIRGLVYDLATGRLEPCAPASPLSASSSRLEPDQPARQSNQPVERPPTAQEAT